MGRTVDWPGPVRSPRWMVVVLSVLFCGWVHGETTAMEAKVVHVDDGDTVVVLQESKQQTVIRLASIDAPESSHTKKKKGRIGQPYSENSKRALESLTKGKTVRLTCYERDRHSREVCDIYAGDVWVNEWMVRAGWAWANLSSNGRYLRDKTLVEKQGEASRKRLGLWAGTKPIAPWEWRRVCWEQGVCQ